MNITVIGRGNVGGGLAELWRAKGHEVQELGRDGGDASGADALVVAVPSGQIGDALAKVSGIDGKVAIDTTNAIKGRPAGFESLAHEVRSITGGPTSKAFNTVFARQYGDLASAEPTPSCFWCGDDEAAAVTEQLVRDAGYDPVRVGDLSRAAALEDFLLGVVFPVSQTRGGPFFYSIR
jgi:8-hydroxy-5-deazaflavin:NADPH oxidoreductase